MPRLSKRCETLTPKMKRLHPFVACFFDLPLKNVLKILNVSHHTLDPIRRSMGMKKWPFVDIVRGKYCQREEIVALRARMMPVADTEMQRVLCRVAACAEDFWTNGTKRIERTRRRAGRSPAPSEPPVQPPSTPEAEPAETCRQEEEEEEDPWLQDGDETFWNDMNDLFGMAERAFLHEAPFCADERGLFSE